MFTRLPAKVIVAIATVMLFETGLPANAVTFDIVGINDTGNTAEVDFVYDPTQERVTISIKNTGTFGSDPRITALAFNAPAAVTGVDTFSVSGTANDSDWDALFSSNGIDTPGNIGFLDVAALTGPNFNGGSPNSGIVVNTTATFIFDLLGSGLQLLTEYSFLDLLSDPDDQRTFFAARFQRTGPDGEGSDVATGVSAIPLPGALPLFGAALGILGLIGSRRNRRRATAA